MRRRGSHTRRMSQAALRESHRRGFNALQEGVAPNLATVQVGQNLLHLGQTLHLACKDLFVASGRDIRAVTACPRPRRSIHLSVVLTHKESEAVRAHKDMEGSREDEKLR
jgi:hypothetical protein